METGTISQISPSSIFCMSKWDCVTIITSVTWVQPNLKTNKTSVAMQQCTDRRIRWKERIRWRWKEFVALRKQNLKRKLQIWQAVKDKKSKLTMKNCRRYRFLTRLSTKNMKPRRYPMYEIILWYLARNMSDSWKWENIIIMIWQQPLHLPTHTACDRHLSAAGWWAAARQWLIAGTSRFNEWSQGGGGDHVTVRCHHVRTGSNVTTGNNQRRTSYLLLNKYSKMLCQDFSVKEVIWTQKKIPTECPEPWQIIRLIDLKREVVQSEWNVITTLNMDDLYVFIQNMAKKLLNENTPSQKIFDLSENIFLIPNSQL